MTTLVFPGFLSTDNDTDALVAAGVPEVRAVSLTALTDGATREVALARAARLVHDGDTLVGYSMGARVVLALLAEETIAARVRHALIVSGSPGLESDDERAARAHLEREWAQALRTDARGFVDTWSEGALFAPLLKTDAGERQLARRRALAEDPVLGPRWGGRWAHVTETLGQAASRPMWSALPQIRTPTWWITGALDARYGELAARAAALMPRSRHVVVDGCGHALLLEVPEIIALRLAEMSRVITPLEQTPLFTDEGVHT